MKHRIKEELHFVLMFVGIVWAVYFIDWLLPGTFNVFGLAPRQTSGLIGLVTMPFLHGNWEHLVGNSVPLVVLLCLLAGSRANTYTVVPQIMLVGGLLLWLFGRPQTIHVGASGLIYGLIAFLIVSGFTEKRLSAIVIAIFVGVTYGATLVGGILPISVDAGVSWDGHLFGAIGGAIVAKVRVRRKPDSTASQAA